MSFILRLLGTSLGSGTLNDERLWTNGLLTSTVAGVPVDAEAAQKLSTVWRCVRLLSETVAGLPLIMFENIANGEERRRATNHPLYAVLHDQPNAHQSAFEFWELMLGYVLLRGNAYAIIQPGPRGPVDQLIPVHPDRVKVERLESGRLRYLVRQGNGIADKPYNDEDIFHLRGPSADGVTGMSIIDYAQESFGMGLAGEKYGARFFRNDSKPSGILSTDKKLSPGAKERLASDWKAMHGGTNQHQVAVLEEGLNWQAVSITPEEAQFLQTREFQAEDVCRWFGVPPHMVGLTSKATSWGSGIEQMSIGFVTYTLMPWLVRIQQAISRDLIIAPQRYFAEFVVAGLLRGDTLARYQAYQTGINTGFMTRNEARRLENMNPLPGLDEPLQPLNMGTAGGSFDAETRGRGDAASSHYRMLAEESAGRLVRKEIAAVERILSRVIGNGDGREGKVRAVEDFYLEHADLVAQAMRIPPGQALAYCQSGANEVLTKGLVALADWETRRVAELANLAIEYGMTTEKALATVRKVAESSPFWR